MKSKEMGNKRAILIVFPIIVAIILLGSIILLYPEPEHISGGGAVATGAFSVETDNSTGNYTLKLISTSDILNVEDYTCSFMDGKGNKMIDKEPITELSGDVTFYDNDNDGKLTKGDTFYIIGEPYGSAKEDCKLRIYYNLKSFSETILC
jgi:hypothetical protein